MLEQTLPGNHMCIKARQTVDSTTGKSNRTAITLNTATEGNMLHIGLSTESTDRTNSFQNFCESISSTLELSAGVCLARNSTVGVV